jgi:hypothetical protein
LFVYVAALFVLHDRPGDFGARLRGGAAITAILVTTLTDQAVLLTGVVLAVLVAIEVTPRAEVVRSPGMG